MNAVNGTQKIQCTDIRGSRSLGVYQISALRPRKIHRKKLPGARKRYPGNKRSIRRRKRNEELTRYRERNEGTR